MSRDFYNRLKNHIEFVDIAFVAIRTVLLLGGVAWLILSEISQETFKDVSSLLIYFAAYSAFIYLFLFLFSKKKRAIYLFLLLLDLSLVSLLVSVTGESASPFFNGFYLITALYSFYYGYAAGLIIAALSTAFYFLSSGLNFNILHWTDFSVRAAFLFLLALPLGMLSGKLKKDRDKIEKVNNELQESLKNIWSLQGKLVQAEKLSAIGRLTADVAHEIRNPLTSIGGFARRLDKKLSEGAKEKEYAGLIVSEVDRLERILRDVLTFSREARSHMKAQDISDTVKESIKAFTDICHEQSITIKENIDTALPPILLDHDQVAQAINNLISNAVDAMPHGGALKVTTSIEHMYDIDYVVVEISDTGCGIPEDKLSVIFEAFYSTKKIGVGTGLGLSICKKIMDEHNGLIKVESTLNKGTSFKLFFPYQSREESAKIKCWEFHKCGVEKEEGSAGMRCAAYPDYGRICWAVAGTFCGKKVSGAIAQKLGDCRKCEFYQRVALKKDL